MCRVTMGHLRATAGHLRVSIGHLRVSIGHPLVTTGCLRATVGSGRHFASASDLLALTVAPLLSAHCSEIIYFLGRQNYI